MQYALASLSLSQELRPQLDKIVAKTDDPSYQRHIDTIKSICDYLYPPP